MVIGPSEADMHEIAITRHIVDAVCERAAGRRVHTVRMWSTASPPHTGHRRQAIPRTTDNDLGEWDRLCCKPIDKVNGDGDGVLTRNRPSLQASWSLWAKSWNTTSRIVHFVHER
jgi:hypothetical protein